MATPARRTTVGSPNFTGDPKGGFAHHSDFLAAVLRFGDSEGHVYDERLRPLAAAGSDEQGAYSDPHGGFLVPEGLALVLRVPPSADPMAAVTDVPMRTPVMHLPARVDKNHANDITGGLKMVRIPETVEHVVQRAKLERVTLTANELGGLTFASDRIVNDNPEAFLTWLEMAYRDAEADTLRTERIRGTGVGESLGVLNSPCLITVAKEGGQAADTVVGDNTRKMVARCWGADDGATFIANPELREQLEKITVLIGTAGVVSGYTYARHDGERPRLHGIPVFYDERASAVGDVGDIILGKWSEYLSGTYLPLKVASSMHVRFAAREQAIQFYQRGDGAPWWRSAITPKYGTATLSPFVTLAAR